MRDNLLCDFKRQHALAAAVLARQRHHQRRDGEMHGVLKAEYQRHRDRSRWAKRKQRQSRPHISDVSISSREPLYGRFGDIAARGAHGEGKQQEKNQESRERRRQHEPPRGQLLNRRFGDQFEKQRGQRDIDDEQVHPAQRLHGLAGELGDGISPEKSGRKTV